MTDADNPFATFTAEELAKANRAAKRATAAKARATLYKSFKPVPIPSYYIITPPPSVMAPSLITPPAFIGH